RSLCLSFRVSVRKKPEQRVSPAPGPRPARSRCVAFRPSGAVLHGNGPPHSIFKRTAGGAYAHGGESYGSHQRSGLRWNRAGADPADCRSSRFSSQPEHRWLHLGIWLALSRVNGFVSARGSHSELSNGRLSHLGP